MAGVTPGDAATETAIDGRRARAERNRQAVIEAILGLLRDGDERPGAAAIAERAGVSLRSVFRHFDDLESLYAAAVEQQAADVWGRFTARIPPEGPLPERVTAFVKVRGELYEEIAPVRRVAERLRDRSASIASGLAELDGLQRDQLAGTFGPELEGRSDAEAREVLDALALVSSWAAWQRLRRDQGCSVPRARRVVGRALGAVLAADG